MFGNIIAGNVVLNKAGEVIERIWNEIPVNFSGVDTDAFQLMPNHLHGILVFSLYHSGEKTSLLTVIQRFKRDSTLEYIAMVKQGILPRFRKRVWQRSYYEHIVRDEKDMSHLREYIKNNPMKWAEDHDNPVNW